MATVVDLEGKTLFPLSHLLNISDFPGFAFDLGEATPDFLDKIYYTEAVIQSTENGLHCKAILVIPEEISFKFAGTDSFAFVLV